MIGQSALQALKAAKGIAEHVGKTAKAAAPGQLAIAENATDERAAKKAAAEKAEAAVKAAAAKAAAQKAKEKLEAEHDKVHKPTCIWTCLVEGCNQENMREATRCLRCNTRAAALIECPRCKNLGPMWFGYCRKIGCKRQYPPCSKGI